MRIEQKEHEGRAPPGTRGARPSSYGVPDGDFAGPPGKDGGDDRAPGHDERYTVDGRRWRAAGGDREEDRREPQHGVEVMWQHLLEQIYERIRPASLNSTGLM